MQGQLDIFSFLTQKTPAAGDYVEKDILGKRLAFNEFIEHIGELIIVDKSTSSHEWYKVVLVEKIVNVEEKQRLLVYYDGTRQRGVINEMYFSESMMHPVGAWELGGRKKHEYSSSRGVHSNIFIHGIGNRFRVLHVSFDIKENAGCGRGAEKADKKIQHNCRGGFSHYICDYHGKQGGRKEVKVWEIKHINVLN